MMIMITIIVVVVIMRIITTTLVVISISAAEALPKNSRGRICRPRLPTLSGLGFGFRV